MEARAKLVFVKLYADLFWFMGFLDELPET